MEKTKIHMHWDTAENALYEAMVNLPDGVDNRIMDLLNLCSETAPYRRVDDAWDFCPDVFPIFVANDPITNWFDCDNPINHVDNIPQNYARSFISYTYELEINDGVMTIYSDLDENLKVRISIEEFRKFHKHYCEVRVTRQSVTFEIELL